MPSKNLYVAQLINSTSKIEKTNFSSSIDHLSDVDLINKQDGDFLIYDSVNSYYRPYVVEIVSGGDITTLTLDSINFTQNSQISALDIIQEGLFYFNEDNDSVIGLPLSLGTWSAGGNVPASFMDGKGAGTLTAGLLTGGKIYNSANPSSMMATASGPQGSGHRWIYDAGAYPGIQGINYNQDTLQTRNSTYEYNGTNWSTGGNLSQSRFGHVSFGSQNAAVIAAGVYFTTIDDPTYSAANQVRNVEKYRTTTQEYNGSSWSNSGTFPTNCVDMGSAGSINAGITTGGSYHYYADATPPEEYGYDNNGITNPVFSYRGTYEYNGSSWSTGDSMITSREAHGLWGTQNSLIAGGGIIYWGTDGSSYINSYESYNGSSWSNDGNIPSTVPAVFADEDYFGYDSNGDLITNPFYSPNMVTGHFHTQGAGGSNSALYPAGNRWAQSFYAMVSGNSYVLNNTSEFNGSTWSVGGAMSSARSGAASGGNSSAAFCCGGHTQWGWTSSDLKNSTEEYTDSYGGVDTFSLIQAT